MTLGPGGGMPWTVQALDLQSGLYVINIYTQVTYKLAQ
jgi:hypothetical protein